MATFKEISEAAEVKTGTTAELISSATKGQVSFATRGDKLVSNVAGFGFTEGQVLTEAEAISALQLGGGLGDRNLDFSQRTPDRSLSNQFNIPAVIEEQKSADLLRRRGIEDRFRPLIDEAKLTGRKEGGGATRAIGRLRGEGFSSAANAFVQGVQDRATKRVNDLIALKNQALNEFDANSATQINNLILKAIDRQDKLEETSFNQALALRGQDIAEKSFELSLINTLGDIPEGQEITIGGQTFIGLKPTDPFFSSSDIVSIMKELDIGTSTSFTDPNTGQEFTIEGISQVRSNLKQFTFTGSNGDFMIANFDPTGNDGRGEILSVASAGKKQGRASAGGTGTDEGEVEGATTEKQLTFEEFVQEKQEELQFSFANPEDLREEYNEIINSIDAQMGGTVIRGKSEGFDFLNQVISASPEATYEELYILARSRLLDLSIEDVKTFLRSKGLSKVKAGSATGDASELSNEEFLELLNQPAATE